jgi:hypothetical protein
MDIFSDSRSKPQVPQTIAAETSRLATGSTQVQPVKSSTPPAITTPAETTASVAKCANTLRIFRSCCRPAISSHADKPLITMATPATIITVSPFVYSGLPKRRIASHAIAPVATNSRMALMRAERIEADRNP